MSQQPTPYGPREPHGTSGPDNPSEPGGTAGYGAPPPPQDAPAYPQDSYSARAPYASAPSYASPPPYASGPGYGSAYAPPSYSPYAVETYAHWGRRVGAMVLDVVILIPGWSLVVYGFVLIGAGAGSRTRPGNTAVSGTGLLLLLVGYAVMIGITIWNRYLRAGRTGQSWGKKVLGIRLVREADGRPIGAGMAFARDLAHTLDGFLYLGYLWPLWDPKRQTFADKVCSTVVLAH